MKLSFHKTRLLLKETFSIAYGNYDSRDALLVRLSYLDKEGYGECVGINYYGIDLEDYAHTLEKIKPQIETYKITTPQDFFSFLKSLGLHPFLLSALDCAYWDLYGKLENKTFSELNKIQNTHLPDSSLTISIAGIDEQIRKIEKSSWTKFKVKCKGFEKPHFQKLLSLKKEIALDANTSFTQEDCLWLQEQPESQQLLYIEQPLEIGNYENLNAQGFVNWMADEDAQEATHLAKLSHHYRSINIKLMKCGGLTPALEMISKAKNLGFKIMLGCMTESSVGISADCALAGLLDYADLDGAHLISNDFATGSFVDNGKIILSEKPGLGISLKPL